MRIVNRILGLIIAAALGTLGVLVIVEVIGYYVNEGVPVLIDYRPWLDWAATTQWSANPIAIGAIVAAVIGFIWLIFELKPARARVVETPSATPGVQTVYTRSGIQSAVSSSVGVLDGVQSVSTSLRGKKVIVSAVSAAREPSAVTGLQPAVNAAAQERLNTLALAKPLTVKAHVLTSRK